MCVRGLIQISNSTAINYWPKCLLYVLQWHFSGILLDNNN